MLGASRYTHHPSGQSQSKLHSLTSPQPLFKKQTNLHSAYHSCIESGPKGQQMTSQKTDVSTVGRGDPGGWPQKFRQEARANAAVVAASRFLAAGASVDSRCRVTYNKVGVHQIHHCHCDTARSETGDGTTPPRRNRDHFYGRSQHTNWTRIPDAVPRVTSRFFFFRTLSRGEDSPSAASLMLEAQMTSFPES